MLFCWPVSNFVCFSFKILLYFLFLSIIVVFIVIFLWFMQVVFYGMSSKIVWMCGYACYVCVYVVVSIESLLCLIVIAIVIVLYCFSFFSSILFNNLLIQYYVWGKRERERGERESWLCSRLLCLIPKSHMETSTTTLTHIATLSCINIRMRKTY